MVTNKMVSLYEKYKTEWMLEHGITMDEFIRVLDNYRSECEQDGDEFNSIEDVLNNFEDDGSFGGEIWACYDEWQDSEFFEELCDRIRDKVRIDWVEDTEDLDPLSTFLKLRKVEGGITKERELFVTVCVASWRSVVCLVSRRLMRLWISAGTLWNL